MRALTRTLKATIEAADRAITAEDFDELMRFYADDAMLVVKPGLPVTGKDSIRRAFVAMAGYFNYSIVSTRCRHFSMRISPSGNCSTQRHPSVR